MKLNIQLWLLTCALTLSLTQPSQAQVLLDESFTNVAGLSGAGWFFQNNSTSASPTGAWQQGSPTSSFNVGLPSGPAGAYATSSFEAIGSAVGNLNDWMLTPVLTITNGSVISFYTRTNTNSDFPERLQLRISPTGPSTNVGASSTDFGDYSTLLLDINPDLLPGSSNYPDTWTQFIVTVSGLSGSVDTRIAFRHFVENSGVDGVNGDEIGIDNLMVMAAVPEPASLALVGTVLVGGVWYYRRTRKKKLAISQADLVQ